MSQTKVAKLFRNGRSQAVRLPKEFRFPGNKVRIRRIENGVLLEPLLDVKEWFARMDEVGGEPLTEGDHNDYVTPSRQSSNDLSVGR